MPYRFERHYRSRVHFNGPLGANWDFTYNMRLVPHPTESNQAILYDGKGRGDAYIILSDGTYLPPNAHFQKLIKESDNSLLLRQANGTIFKFYALDSSVQSGKLASILNRCGNRMTFEYNAKGQLVGTAI
jgi:YD repeat-containing protein